MQFRRRILRVVLFVVVLIVLYLLIGFIPRDTILARSINRYGRATIIVRKVSSAPFWAWPLSVIEDAPQHRFEYYFGSTLWTCESYTGDSYSAHSATVEWDSTGTVATVSLDGSSVFVCTYGHWTEFKSR